MSDDTPTQRFDVASSTAGGGAVGDNRKTRLAAVLGVVGGVLLIVVVALLVLLLRNGGSQQTAADASTISPASPAAPSSTPVPVPTVTFTVAPSPVANKGGGNTAPDKPNGSNVLITQYTISPLHPDCSSGHADLDITWKSVNGGGAYFGVNTVDAMAGGMGWNLPASGTQNDFPAGYHPFEYTCGNASESYTITVLGTGSKQSLTITVHRK